MLFAVGMLTLTSNMVSCQEMNIGTGKQTQLATLIDTHQAALDRHENLVWRKRKEMEASQIK